MLTLIFLREIDSAVFVELRDSIDWTYQEFWYSRAVAPRTIGGNDACISDESSVLVSFDALSDLKYYVDYINVIIFMTFIFV